MSIRISRSGSIPAVLALVIFWILFIGQGFAAWATHVITCINSERWILLVVGAIMVPVGWLHGWAIWLGYSF
jgi:hypothetical protein